MSIASEGFSAPPAATAPRAYHFPRTERGRIGAGTQVVVAPLHRVPLVTVTVVLHRAGAVSDPDGQAGLADITSAMLLEGTDAMDGAALAEHFEGLGSSLGASADWDATLVSFTVQPSRLGAAMLALRGVLRAPAFDQRQLTRLQAEHHASRMQLIAEPRALANAAFAASCYDGLSRYRRSVDGGAACVSALTRDNVVAFWRTQYAPDAMTIIVAGDVTAEQAVESATTLVDGWAARANPPAAVHTAPRSTMADTTLVARPGAAQAELRIGQVGVPRSHEAFFPLTVMNAVLGGLFSSRINLNLREQHGYTYGASSGFDWRNGPGPWVVSTAVASDVCGAAAREVLSEIDRIRAADISAEELALASDFLVGVFPLRFETTSAVAAALASQAVFGVPDNYFDVYRDRIRAVTIADVRRAATEHLHRDALQLVAVGEPQPLREQLTTLGVSAVRILTPEEVEAI